MNQVHGGLARSFIAEGENSLSTTAVFFKVFFAPSKAGYYSYPSMLILKNLTGSSLCPSSCRNLSSTTVLMLAPPSGNWGTSLAGLDVNSLSC